MQPDSPADKAGVQRGDVITAVNGEAVKDSNVLRNEVAQLPPGSTVQADVVRGGKEQAVNGHPGEAEKTTADS